jgi:uncharacterized protein (DUF58 family)
MRAGGVGSRLTREGKVVALLGVGFLLGALNTGTNLLYLVAGLILAATWANHRAARRAVHAVTLRRPAPEHGVVGGPLVVRLEVEAAGGTLAPVLIEERVEPGLLERAPRALVLELPRGGRASARASAKCLRRGRVLLPGPRVVTSAPFGLVEHTREVDLPAEALVLPRTYPLRAGALERAAPPAEAVARKLTFSPERRDVVRGLRDLRPGDDVRTVHWRSSARRGSLLVKEFERTAPKDALVLLHLPAQVEGAVDLEPAVTAAASLVAHLVHQGERVALGIAGAGAPVTVPVAGGEAALGRALEALALAAPGDADWSALLEATRRWARGAQTFVVTTAAAAPPCAGARAFVVRSREDAARLLRGPPGRPPAGEAA